jgi:hypothetical protein
MYNRNSSSPTFNKCTFNRNKADSDDNDTGTGGAIYSDNSDIRGTPTYGTGGDANIVGNNPKTGTVDTNHHKNT